ncbi:hypothetical protein ACUXIW_004314 [Ralstonia pickettii]|jgi:hypothetical protein|uniref:Uncharacterized protein n=1 Tax=Ralstonia insidiosa TaxID=190721 RepID=A0A192A809_9RALS|nr:hypothetical protein A9Y76_28445 [Ralstonia insidiosa]MBA9884377.1 hypothetical protein [Ralstonia pickettii]MBA9894135.1 hypothetical protein [Ralstonia pickettii]MBA9926188.1 hypothetical protein [Ralstonia pickettii]MBB0094492.1 hypothetical protein [Ralstonia pickettii]
MISLERDTYLMRQGREDARFGMPSRARDLQCVSEQLAYRRGYRKPDSVQVLKTIAVVSSVVALLAWALWGFSMQIEALKYGTAITLSPGWGNFCCFGSGVPFLITLLWHWCLPAER